MAGINTTGHNVLPFPRSRGRQRVVGLAMEGLHIPRVSTNTGEQDVGSDSRYNPAAIQQLVDKHIGFVRQVLQAKTPPRDLSTADIAKITSAAQHITDQNPESIVQTVLATAHTAMPVVAQNDFKKHLETQGITEGEYFAALARVGAGYNNAESLVAAYRASCSRDNESSDGSKGNMTGSEYTGSLYGYPGYGGTAFTNERAAYTYANANYGMNREVSSQLYNIGVRSSAQMQQVVSDVGKIGLGSGKENLRYTNAVALDVAKLRKAEGASTDQHLAEVHRHGVVYRELQEKIAQAEARGDNKTVVNQLKQQLDLEREKTNNYTVTHVKTDAGRTAHGSIIIKTEKEIDEQMRYDRKLNPVAADHRQSFLKTKGRISQEREQEIAKNTIAPIMPGVTSDDPALRAQTLDKEERKIAAAALDDFAASTLPAIKTEDIPTAANREGTSKQPTKVAVNSDKTKPEPAVKTTTVNKPISGPKVC